MMKILYNIHLKLQCHQNSSRQAKINLLIVTGFYFILESRRYFDEENKFEKKNKYLNFVLIQVNFSSD